MEELLQQILAEPESDHPRRVYADWLAERGDPRGELIAVQCELAHSFELGLAIREQQLLSQHGPRWIAEMGIEPRKRSVPGQVPQVLFRRGFPDQIELALHELARIDLSRVPVRSLVVDGVNDANVGDLVAQPAIATVCSFGLRRAHLKPRSQRRLGEAPLVTTASRLALHQGGASDASELANLALPELRALRLDDPKIRNIEVLARARWLAQVEELSIRDTYHARASRLLRAKTLRLTKLVVETNLADSELVALANADTMRDVEHLELAFGYYDANGLAAFARTTGFAKLQRFVVRGNILDDARAQLHNRWGERLTFV